MQTQSRFTSGSVSYCMFHKQTCIYRPPCCYSTTWWVLYVHIFWPAYNDHQSTKNVLCLLTSGLCSQAWLRYWVKMFNKKIQKGITKMIQLLSLYGRMYYWLYDTSGWFVIRTAVRTDSWVTLLYSNTKLYLSWTANNRFREFCSSS